MRGRQHGQEVNASFCSVRRGRRPHGTPRNFMHETRETSEILDASPAAGRRAKASAARLACTNRGVTLRHSTDGSFEQRRRARRRRVRREGCVSRRTLLHLTRTRLSAGLRVSHGWASVRPNDMAGRYSSEIRTGCANQRPSGSVRGAASRWLSLPRSSIILETL